nr:MAG TPA: Protein of unknown function (DUF2577) [Caudoviricetes sp.]
MNKGINTFFEIFKDEQARNSKDEPFAIGRVTSISPLTIQIEDLPLYSKNLRINPYLLEWIETVNITTSTNEGHSHSISTITHPSKLAVGSYVICYGIEYDSGYNGYKKYAVLEVIS